MNFFLLGIDQKAKMNWFASETLAQKAQQLNATYAERRKAAIAAYQAKLISDWEARILRKASQGKTRLILHFDRIFASDLHPCDELTEDFTDAEAEELRVVIQDWAKQQGLELHQRETSMYKLTVRWD